MSKLIILLTLIITAISEETINITTSDMTGGSSYTIIYNGLRKFPNNIYFNGLEIFQYEPNNTDTYYEITDDNYLNIIPVTSGGPNEITLFILQKSKVLKICLQIVQKLLKVYPLVMRLCLELQI